MPSLVPGNIRSWNHIHHEVDIGATVGTPLTGISSFAPANLQKSIERSALHGTHIVRAPFQYPVRKFSCGTTTNTPIPRPSPFLLSPSLFATLLWHAPFQVILWSYHWLVKVGQMTIDFDYLWLVITINFLSIFCLFEDAWVWAWKHAL